MKMMGAAQPFISGAISKTVNLPEEATVEEIEQAYIEGWQHGLKALAIYRDGSKQGTGAQHVKGRRMGRRKKAPIPRPVRRRLPATRDIGHSQVRDRGPRGIHHRRPLR